VHGIGDSYEYLRRRYRRAAEGMYIEAAPGYVEVTLTELGLQECKVALTPETPGDKNILQETEGVIKLEGDEKALYARCGMRLLFLAQDRLDCGHAVRRISTSVASPDREAMARLKRLGRYLSGKRRLANLLPVEGSGIEELEGCSDSDWAQNLVTRKSVSCGTFRIGGCLQGGYVRGQDVLATSSGQAEFFACGSLVNEGIGICQVYSELGFPLEFIVKLDSAAAIGMCQRRGVGKVRHLDIRYLHVQDCLRDGRITAIQKIPGEEKLADVGTKVLGRERLEFLTDQLGYYPVDKEGVCVGSIVAAGVGSVELDPLWQAVSLLVGEARRRSARPIAARPLRWTL